MISTAPCALSAPLEPLPPTASARIDIEAQALDSALAAWRSATGLGLTVDPELLAGKAAAPVHGDFDAGESLRRLTAGSGLLPAPTASGDWSLQPDASAPAVESIVIVGTRQKAMVARQGVETRDLPEAITVIPKAVLEEAAARRYEDIAYSTVGLTPYVPFANAGSSGGYSRGFNANLLVDGFTQGFAGLTSGLGIVDHVEVLRGPTSVLYGQGDPGGSVNLVLKRPLAQFGFASSATVDDLGTRLIDLDVTGPIADGPVDYRIVAQGEDSKTFRDFEKNRRAQIAPMLSAALWQGGQLNLLASFDRYDYSTIRQFSYYTGAFPIGRLESFPVGRNFSEPSLPLSRLDTRVLRGEFSQRLADDWTATIAAYDYRSTNERYEEIRTLSPEVEGSSVYDRQFVETIDPDRNRNKSRTYTLRLSGDVAAFGVRHRVLFGAERLTNDFGYNDVIGDYLPIDIDHPSYQSSFVAPGDLEPHNVGGQSIATDAAYVNDLVSIGAQWKVQLGARYDHIDSTGYGDVSRDTIVDHKLSPSVGVVWQPGETTSLYASYSTAFVPQIGRDRNGEALAPERSKAYEIGVKQEVFDRRMAVTAAAFDIVKNDILQTDPTDADFVLNGGKAKSQGFELEVEGRTPIDGLTVRGGAAYAYARITDSTDFPSGTRLVGPRPWTALASARQRLSPFGIEDAWASASAYFGGSAQAAAPSNGEKLPSFTRIDLAAGKTFGGFELQINLKNLLNDRIFVSNGGGLLIFDNPRSIGATLSYRTGAF